MRWAERATKFHIAVALIQSLLRKGWVSDAVADYGHVIVNECRHDPVLFMPCGPVQHCVDAAANRRDRRKGMLLQTLVYLMRRFLTDDLGKERESVLDTVLRVMAGWMLVSTDQAMRFDALPVSKFLFEAP